MRSDHLRTVRAMGSNRVKRVPLRAKRWRRAGDGFRATVTAIVLSGMLLLIFAVAAVWRTSTIAASNAKVRAAAEQEAAERQANRIGSVVFVSRKKMCEEIRFDNIAERILSIGDVDCEARFTAELRDDGRAQKRSARIQGVLAGFGR